MMTHHSVMTSSLRIKNLKYLPYIYPPINQCEPRRPKDASGGHFVFTSRAAQASEARLYYEKRKVMHRKNRL